jgi:hypothetical protein
VDVELPDSVRDEETVTTELGGFEIEEVLDGVGGKCASLVCLFVTLSATGVFRDSQWRGFAGAGAKAGLAAIGW